MIEGLLEASLFSREMATIGPSARVNGDVIYKVLELDRVSAQGVRPIWRRLAPDDQAIVGLIPWSVIRLEVLHFHGDETVVSCKRQILHLPMVNSFTPPALLKGASLARCGFVCRHCRCLPPPLLPLENVIPVLRPLQPSDAVAAPSPTLFSLSLFVRA